MYPEASAGFPHTGFDLDQLEPDGINLGGFQLGAAQVTAQQPEKSISGSMQQQPVLIGQETVATQTIGLDFQFQFFNPVLDIASQDIDIV
jgi:hypothetical protein